VAIFFNESFDLLFKTVTEDELCSYDIIVLGLILLPSSS